MKPKLQFVLISVLLSMVSACAADGSAKAGEAADSRTKSGTPQPAASNATRLKYVIPAGTVLSIALIDSLRSDKNSTGDHFAASLTAPVMVGNTAVLPVGTEVEGVVVSVDDGGKVKGLANIQIELVEIVAGERRIAIVTDTYSATADPSKTRDAEIIAGSGGVGAAIGAIAGGKKGAAIGTAVGGGAGTGVVLATKGKQIQYESETHLNFTLSKSVQF